MKKLLVLFVLWAGLPAHVVADLVTYRFAGVVIGQNNTGVFTGGHPYTLTIVINTAAHGNSTVPERTDYTNAITSSYFNYDSGNYVAQGTNGGTVSVENDDRGLYDHFLILGLPGFSSLAGQPLTSCEIHLIDTNHIVFSNNDLPQILPVDAFQQRYFNIGWGIDWDTRGLDLSIDSITVIQRRPAITSWTRTIDSLAFNIEFAGQSCTNLLERSFAIGSSAQWEVVSSCVASGGNTNWTVPLQMDQPSVFYRVKGQ